MCVCVQTFKSFETNLVSKTSILLIWKLKLHNISSLSKTHNSLKSIQFFSLNTYYVKSNATDLYYVANRLSYISKLISWHTYNKLTGGSRLFTLIIYLYLHHKFVFHHVCVTLKYKSVRAFVIIFICFEVV